MSALVDPFLDNAFMQRALLAGVLVAIACAVVGTFVVLRGLAFIGDALAHGVLPGIAGAILLGLPGMVGAAVGAVVMIGGVTLVTSKSRLSSDTAIGLLFVGMLAAGVVIVSRSTSFTGDLTRILFGDVLGIGRSDLIVQGVATAGVLVISLVCIRPFLLLCFDEEHTCVAGFAARRYHLLQLALIAVTVVVSFQTVGTLLVFGMLLAPAGAAALVASRVSTMMLIAAVIGSLSIVVGLLISYHANLAAGASVVLVEIAVFFAVLLVVGVRHARRAASVPA
mgnify:CR=1 FL=1